MSPWIAEGSECVRVTDMLQHVDRLDIATKGLQEVCRLQDGAARRKDATKLGTQRQNRDKTLPCLTKQALLHDVTDYDCYRC